MRYGSAGEELHLKNDGYIFSSDSSLLPPDKDYMSLMVLQISCCAALPLMLSEQQNNN